MYALNMDVFLLTKLSLVEVRTHQDHFSVCQNHLVNVNLTPRLHVDIVVHLLSILRLPSQVVAKKLSFAEFYF